MIMRPASALDLKRWRNVFVLGVATMVALHAADIFLRPWLMGVGDVVIADDARQFLAWMPRLTDPAALPGDWMADFWQALSPPAYAAVYRLAASLGIAPTIAARLVSMATLAVSGVAAWRLARGIAPTPAISFCAAAFLMAFLSKEDSIFSATPRGLAVPAILFFLDGLNRDRWGTMAIAGAALALLYPAPGATLVTMLALSRLRWSPGERLRIAGGGSSIVRVGGLGVLMAMLVLLFREQAKDWGPALTLDQARHMATLMTPGGRSTLVNETGAIDYLCSMRSGYLPEIIPCGRGIPFATVANLLFLAPMIALGVRGLRSGGRERIYGIALAAALIWFTLAWLVAFRLHLPSRFSQRVLYPLEWLAIGHVIGQAIVAARAGPLRRYASGAAACFLMLAFATPLALLQTPTDRRIVDLARALPADTRIGGVSDDLQFLPALAGRAITGSPQHAIPWELGYYARVRQGMADDLLLISTSDHIAFGNALRRSGAQVLLLPAAVLAGEVPDSYVRALPDEARATRERLADGVPLLRTIAPACRLKNSDFFSAACLARASTR